MVMKKILIASGIILSVLAMLFLALGYVIDTRDLEFGKVETNSMEPTLKPGDWDVLDRKATPKIGDIIVFHCAHENTKCFEMYESDRIGHRLTSIDPDGCMHIIGDNKEIFNWDTLPCFPPEDIVIEGVIHKLWF